MVHGHVVYDPEPTWDRGFVNVWSPSFARETERKPYLRYVVNDAGEYLRAGYDYMPAGSSFFKQAAESLAAYAKRALALGRSGASTRSSARGTEWRSQ